MKRNNTKHTNVVGGDIYKHYGLFFWQECFFCNKEFRREAGYRFQIQVDRDWVKEFVSKQETLSAEFQQILEDHISELYEK